MQHKMKIVADVDIPFLKGVLEPWAEVSYLKGDRITPQEVVTADALLVRTRTRCNAELLAGSAVRFIGTATIGEDHIDRNYCRAHGIRVARAAGCNARGVLQYVMGALAALADAQGWQPAARTLGVIGVGHVGSLVAQFADRFGFRVLCCDPPRMEQEPNLDFVSLDTLLAQSDMVTLHVPRLREGTHPTEGMANADFFARMGTGSVFINSSRGEVMQDDALLAALDSGKLSAAVIDTWNAEPNINLRLLEACTYATPHIAGYSLQGKATGTALVVQALSEAFALPLTTWYPTQVKPCTASPPPDWHTLCHTLPHYFDLKGESAQLKAHPEQFESMRNGYAYRTEYF